MRSKVLEKAVAIRLRKAGYSYRDILTKVPAAKSSISNWLKDFSLTEDEKRTLKKRRELNMGLGRERVATSKRLRRLAREQEFFQTAKKEFELMNQDAFFQVGVALYRAVGTKESEFSLMSGDAGMIQVMVNWIERYLGVPRNNIKARLYSNKFSAHKKDEGYWAEVTGIPPENFGKTAYTSARRSAKKRPDYKGSLRISLHKVVYVRKVMYWQQLLVGHYAGKR